MKPVVSRETSVALDRYGDLLRRWNASLNLIGKSTTEDIWRRHIVDSLQVYDAVERPTDGSWIDLGSGGGLPGIPIHLIASPTLKMTLVEADRRKCEFLRTVRRELGATFDIRTDRIEDLAAFQADFISARALATLDRLLSYAHRLASPSTVLVFPKGQTWEQEHEAAARNWSYDLEAHPSQTDTTARILVIRKLRRAN